MVDGVFLQDQTEALYCQSIAILSALTRYVSSQVTQLLSVRRWSVMRPSQSGWSRCKCCFFVRIKTNVGTMIKDRGLEQGVPYRLLL